VDGIEEDGVWILDGDWKGYNRQATLCYAMTLPFGVWRDTRIQLKTSFLLLLTRYASHPGKFTSINLSTIKPGSKQSATVRLRGGLDNTIRSIEHLPDPAFASSTVLHTDLHTDHPSAPLNRHIKLHPDSNSTVLSA